MSKIYKKLLVLALISAGIKAVAQTDFPWVVEILLDIIIMAGIFSGIAWLVKSYRIHSVQYNEKGDEWFKRLSSGKMDMADWLEFEGHSTSEANTEIKEMTKGKVK